MIRITAAELNETRAKVAKINDRAVRRGFTGHIDLSVERVEVKDIDEYGFERTEVMFDVTLAGDAPKLDGWTFLATLDWDVHAGLITRVVPGAQVEIDRNELKPEWCDHCKTRRHRNSTFLVRHDDGRQVQVGSTCIKDFLGWNANVVILYADDVASDLGFGGYGHSQPDAVGTDYALAVAWALIKLDGYKPANTYSGTPTKSDVMDVLWPPYPMRPERKAELVRISTLATEAMERAKEIRAWVVNEMTGTNEYATNMKAVLSADYVTIRNIGLLASAPQAWMKAQAATLIRDTPTRVSTWLGQEKERITFTATINDIRWIPGDWNTMTLYTLQDADGNVIKWFASRDALGDKPGVTVKLMATVKKHEEYKNVKQTLITRAKVLETKS